MFEYVDLKTHFAKKKIEKKVTINPHFGYSLPQDYRMENVRMGVIGSPGSGKTQFTLINGDQWDNCSYIDPKGEITDLNIHIKFQGRDIEYKNWKFHNIAGGDNPVYIKTTDVNWGFVESMLGNTNTANKRDAFFKKLEAIHPQQKVTKEQLWSVCQDNKYYEHIWNVVSPLIKDNGTSMRDLLHGKNIITVGDGLGGTTGAYYGMIMYSLFHYRRDEFREQRKLTKRPPTERFLLVCDEAVEYLRKGMPATDIARTFVNIGRSLSFDFAYLTQKYTTAIAPEVRDVANTVFLFKYDASQDLTNLAENFHVNPKAVSTAITNLKQREKGDDIPECIMLSNLIKGAPVLDPIQVLPEYYLELREPEQWTPLLPPDPQGLMG